MNQPKIKVGILAATGTVGQRFIQGLADHPWFQITALAASISSVGKKYKEACNWLLEGHIPTSIQNLVVAPCEPNLDCEVVFSALPSEQAFDLELCFAKAGYKVFTNASAHRMQKNVPLLIPEVNHEHIMLAKTQDTFAKSGGYIVANPNCSAVMVVMAIAPLHARFKTKAIVLTTMQALSGAGYPGIASLDILDNVIPFIPSEEEKIAEETRKILGAYNKDGIVEATINLSAHCNRVSVRDGHLETISIAFNNQPDKDRVLEAWQKWQPLSGLGLPTAPLHPILYRNEKDRPQTRLDREAGHGMAISIGRLRTCEVLDWRFVVLGHNAIRGAAGCSILNAELAYQKGML